MCEPECKICWFQKTKKVLHQLQCKSLDVTVHLNEAVKSVQTVNHVVGDFMNTFKELSALGESRPDCLEKKETVIIKKTESEEKQESPVNEEAPADDAKKTNDKHLVEDEDNILFVNITSGLASDGTFWCRYWSNEAPFNDSRLHQISDELGWMEKDLSAEKAESISSDKLLFCYSSVHELYLRSVILKYAPPEETEVRYIDLGKVELVSVNIIFYNLPEDHHKKYPFLNLYCSLYKEFKLLPREARWCFRDLTEEKVLLARIKGETQRHGFPCYQLEMKTMTGVTSNVNKEITKIVLEYEKEEERKAEAKLCKNNLPVPHVTGTKEEDKSQCVVDGKYSKIENSHVPDVKHAIKEDKSKLVKDEKAKEDISVLKEATLLPNENNAVEKPRSRRASDSLIPINIESQEIGQRSSSLSNIENIDPKTVHLDIIQNKCTNEIQPKRGKENTEKPVKKKKSSRDKKQVAKVQASNDEYWVDKIPREERKKVPNKMAPLRNLFYSKYILRQEKWYETELLNITDLLHSESNMAFYALPMTTYMIERSFNSCYIFYQREIENYNIFLDLVESRFGTCSQYFFILNKNKDTSAVNHYVLGIGKIESTHRLHSRANMYISYYSLSNIGEYSIKYSARNSYSLDLNASKILVQKFKLSLECCKSIPVFENYYPWCGIPPLMDLRKPSYPPPQVAKKKKRSQEDLREKKQMREQWALKENKDHFMKNSRKSPVNNPRSPVPVEQSNHTEELWDQDEVVHAKVEESSTILNGVKSLEVETEIYNNTDSSIVEPTIMSTAVSSNLEELNCSNSIIAEPSHSRDNEEKIVTSESVTVRNSDADTCYGDETSKRFEEDWNGNGNDLCTNNPITDNQQKEVCNEPKEVAVVDKASGKEISMNTEWEHDDKPEKLSVNNESQPLSKPIKILQRPAKNVGFYDATGMWFPGTCNARCSVPVKQSNHTEELWDQDEAVHAKVKEKESTHSNGVKSLAVETEAYTGTESSIVETTIMCSTMSSNAEELKKHEKVNLSCSDSVSISRSIDNKDKNVISCKSESFTTPLRNSDVDTCGGDETTKRFEEDWNGNGRDKCTNNPIIVNVQKEVHNEPKEVVVVDTELAKEISVNTEWQHDDKHHGKLTNQVSLNNVSQSLSKPIKIMQRPLKNIGFYDATGMWYPDMDPAIISYQAKIKVINDQYEKKKFPDNKNENVEMEKKNENTGKRFDENENESLESIVTSIETILETPPVVPDSTL